MLVMLLLENAEVSNLTEIRGDFFFNFSSATQSPLRPVSYYRFLQLDKLLISQIS